MRLSKIEWTETTWNPITGCTRVSAGCEHCYAQRMALRLQAMGQRNYANGFAVTCHEQMLELPTSWKKPRTVFANSMSDLFHEAVDDAFIRRVFEVMNEASWHRFQILTKRSQRLRELGPTLHWSDNIWMGVTVESGGYKHRIADLTHSGAKHKFLSLEPLLASLGILSLDEIDWVIVGGESGPGARLMEKDWVVEIRDQCLDAGVPFFFKQWGGVNKKKRGRVLDGRTWNESPFGLSIAQ